MIRMLSDLGRAMVVASAVLIVAIATVAGYYCARPIEFVSNADTELFFSLLGLGFGVIVAGAILGPMATLYDIRDNLRRLIATGSDDQLPVAREQREPRFD